MTSRLCCIVFLVAGCNVEPVLRPGGTPDPAPEGRLIVDLGGDLLTSRGAALSLEAAVTGELGDTGPTDLVYTWTRSDDALAASETSRWDFAAPNDVAGFTVTVVVTDPATDRTAEDEVRVLVVDDVNRARFVDADTGDDTNPGTPEAPLQTVTAGLEQAAAAGADLYLNNPDVDPDYAFDTTVDLPDGVAVYGGFDGNWIRDAGTTPTRLTVSDFVAFRAVGHAGPLRLSGLEIAALAPPDGRIDSVGLDVGGIEVVELDRMVVTGSALTTDPALPSGGFHSGSSVGLRAVDVTQLEILDSRLGGGRGATGPDGDDGSDGGPGADGANASGRFGGDGGTSSHNGQTGGNGGSAEGGVVACTDGNGGGDGSGSGGDGGAGADVELPFPFLICSGVGADSGDWGDGGSRGGNGAVGTVSFAFDEGARFVPSDGAKGSRGAGGAGGGGGGSGPGIDLSVGGGGGGGGEGGEGGEGGFGGPGGGGSFALLAVDVGFAVLERTTLESSDGGAGAAGGIGGSGGPGGDGGDGANSGSLAGANGGWGGNGGQGGTGGGGAGGPSAGAVVIRGVIQLTECEVRTGMAGESTGLNPGDGGWNYGIYLNEANIVPSTVAYVLGAAGNGAPDAAETSP